VRRAQFCQRPPSTSASPVPLRRWAMQTHNTRTQSLRHAQRTRAHTRTPPYPSPPYSCNISTSMDGPSVCQGIEARLGTAASLCPSGGRRRVLTLPALDEDAKPFPDVFGVSFDYVDVPVVRACLRPRTLDLAEAAEADPSSATTLQLKSPILPIRIATPLASSPPPFGMAAAGLLPGPAPLKVILTILEDLNMNFGERDISLSLTGTVQVTSYAGGPPASKQPLEIGVELIDAASQVGTTESNPVLLRPSASPARPGAGPIPETSSPFASFSSPAPSPMDFVCSLPCTTDTFTTAPPLNLLRYMTKPTVRPLPVRLQPSKITVEGDVAHVVVVVTSNRNLYVPLSAMSVTVEVHVPGLELGAGVISAMPSMGVSWAPPLLQWVLPPHEELPPGQSRTFRASLPILNAPPLSCSPFDDIAFVSSPSSSSVYFPSGTVFRAQSKAALTKCTVRLFNLESGAADGTDAPSYEIQQATRKRYRITARAEAR